MSCNNYSSEGEKESSKGQSTDSSSWYTFVERNQLTDQSWFPRQSNVVRRDQFTDQTRSYSHDSSTSKNQADRLHRESDTNLSPNSDDCHGQRYAHHTLSIVNRDSFGDHGY